MLLLVGPEHQPVFLLARFPDLLGGRDGEKFRRLYLTRPSAIVPENQTGGKVFWRETKIHHTAYVPRVDDLEELHLQIEVATQSDLSRS